jgi:hypothetical protein
MVSVSASNVIRQSGRVNGENSIRSSAVSRVTVWSNVAPAGHPFIAHIGPPTERSTVKLRSVFHSL